MGNLLTAFLIVGRNFSGSFTIPSVRVAAILHPYASGKLLKPFKAPAGMNVFRGNELEANDLPDIAIVFGGDGSVHRVIQALAGSQTPLLVVPTGSGNDFADSIGIHSYKDALAAWEKFIATRENVRDIDLGVIRPLDSRGTEEAANSEWIDGPLTFAREDGSFAKPESPLAAAIMRAEMHHVYEAQPSEEYFCCIAGTGLDSETNRRANKLPPFFRRNGGYVVSALRSLATFTFPRIRVSATDAANGQRRELSERSLLVAFANGPTYGNGMQIAPSAKLDDGLLDICYVRNVTKLKVLRVFHTIFSGTHISIPEVEYFQAKSARLTTERPLEIYADGEYVCRTPAEITMRPKSLKLIIP